MNKKEKEKIPTSKDLGTGKVFRKEIFGDNGIVLEAILRGLIIRENERKRKWQIKKKRKKR